MRRLHFRAKSRINGQWAYGIPYKTAINNWIIGLEPIDPETIGQLTDLKDVADRNIYEGDILAFGQKEPSELLPFKGPYHVRLRNPPVICRWSEKYSAFRLVEKDGTDWGVWHRREYIHEHFKVIGNIHDNPTLLTKEQ